MDGLLAQGTSSQLGDSQLWVIIGAGMFVAIYMAVLRSHDAKSRKDL